MTPTELAAAMDTLGWSARHLARLLECHRNLPLRWLDGDVAVPPEIGLWLERLVEAHQLDPAPQDWRTDSRQKEIA